jgi:hypothetical protein
VVGEKFEVVGKRKVLTKEMLLPLSIGKVRSLSLENHLAFATVRVGRGDSQQVINLLRVVYLAFFLREQTASEAEIDLYRRAEAALDACIERAEHAEQWLLLDHEQKAVERLLAVHDEQLAAVPKHRYLAAWIGYRDSSPIRPARQFQLGKQHDDFSGLSSVARKTQTARRDVRLAASVEDFHLQVCAPCRAHEKKPARRRAVESTLSVRVPRAIDTRTGLILAPLGVPRQLATGT